MKKQKSKTAYVYRYSLIDVMLASPSEPLNEHLRVHQLTRMHQGLESMEKSPNPQPEDWRLVSDAVNIMETLVTKGPWPDCDGDLVDITDASGLLEDAIKALAQAGNRHKSGGNIRLDGAGIQAARAVLEDYSSMLEALPARTMIQAHRQTERRIHEILSGKKKPHDVVVMKI
jgi:hypothetical protein